MIAVYSLLLLSAAGIVFFAAIVSTNGMPMVVELGVAFDVLVAAVLFGIFFLHIRTSIDSLDVDLMNKLHEVDK